MRSDLLWHVRIMFIAERACWNFYTREIKECKTAKHEGMRAKRLATDWSREPHLFETLKESLFNIDNLKFMEIPIGESTWAMKTLTLAWTLFEKRSWTMSKHTSPPDCYANILTIETDDASAEKRNAVMREMKIHHNNVLSLERSMLRNDASQDVWKTCLFLSMSPIRLLWEYFKRDQYSPDSEDGRKLLIGLTVRLPDNKIVEDIHAPLRLATKGNSNDRLSACTIQDVINSSNVIETRKIPHNAKVTQDQVSSWAYFRYSRNK